MPRNILSIAVLALSLLSAPLAHATDWGSVLQSAGDMARQAAGESTSSGLTTAEMVDGLKAALKKGVGRAVEQLGAAGGFLDDPEVRIPLPENLAKLGSALRMAGMGDRVDAFEASMNHAAERAVPAGRDVFLKAISSMSVSDAADILNGPDDAATRYFEEATRSELFGIFEPIVSEQTDAVGVTAKYKSMEQSAAAVAPMLGMDAPDLDAYVTDGALDGLFTVLAEEEKRIRTDPAARTTELLKKVFGD